MNEKTPLRDAFAKREKRFNLLEKGLELAGFGPESRLLESGCAHGEAAYRLRQLGYFNITAFDIDEAAVRTARERAPGIEVLRADARNLPFEDGCFDGIYSEAAFSVIPDKAAAAAQYARVLRCGGRLLLNDFTLRGEVRPPREAVGDIPCLAGVQTREIYREVFAEAGLSCIYEREEFFELARIAAALGREYDIPPSAVGDYLVREFGTDGFVTDFFSRPQMSYCQMIFERDEP